MEPLRNMNLGLQQESINFAAAVITVGLAAHYTTANVRLKNLAGY